MRSNLGNPPRVLADGPLDNTLTALLADRVDVCSWESLGPSPDPSVLGILTYGHPPVGAELLDLAPGVRVISNYGVGVDHIDVEEATRRGIPVGNTPGILEKTTADLAFSLLLAIGRRIVEGDAYARSSEFITYDPGYMLGTEIHGATLGILGMGTIGREIARRGRGFEMPILYHNRNRRPELEAELDARWVPWEELLSASDYLVLACPLTDQTRGLIDSRALARMKPGGFLINVARGGVVRTEDLYDALRRGQIAGAALDVTEPEPLPRDHPLLRLPNLVITPHLGSATVATRERMARRAVENLLAGLEGRPLISPASAI